MLLAQLIHLDHGLSLVHNEDLIPASRKLFEHDLILVLYLQLLPIVLVVQASLKPMTCTLANLNDLAKAFLSRCPVASLLMIFLISFNVCKWCWTLLISKGTSEFCGSAMESSETRSIMPALVISLSTSSYSTYSRWCPVA